MPAAAPIDFDSASAAVLTVPTSVRPSGEIKYHVGKHSFRETYTKAGGSFQSIEALVSWSDTDEFIDRMLGFTDWDRAETSRFNRTLPAKSPFQDKLHCETMELMEYGKFAGSVTADEDFNNWPKADWARYGLTFRHLVYDLLTDAQVDGSEYPWAAHGCKELGRYVERLVRYTSQELKLGNYQLETYNAAALSETPQPIPAPGFVPFNSGEIIYVWHEIPYEAVPIPAIANCNGKVNDAAFDKRFNGSAWVDRWPAGTLLFNSTPEMIEPVPGPRGELYVTLKYSFKYQPNGWNKFPQADPTLPWKDVRRRGVNAPLYPSADFRTLFKPRA